MEIITRFHGKGMQKSGTVGVDAEDIVVQTDRGKEDFRVPLAQAEVGKVLRTWRIKRRGGWKDYYINRPEAEHAMEALQRRVLVAQREASGDHGALVAPGETIVDADALEIKLERGRVVVANGRLVINKGKTVATDKDLPHVVATREGSEVKLRFLDGDDPTTLWLPQKLIYHDRADYLRRNSEPSDAHQALARPVNREDSTR